VQTYPVVPDAREAAERGVVQREQVVPLAEHDSVRREETRAVGHGVALAAAVGGEDELGIPLRALEGLHDVLSIEGPRRASAAEEVVVGGTAPGPHAGGGVADGGARGAHRAELRARVVEAVHGQNHAAALAEASVHQLAHRRRQSRFPTSRRAPDPDEVLSWIAALGEVRFRASPLAQRNILQVHGIVQVQNTVAYFFPYHVKSNPMTSLTDHDTLNAYKRHTRSVSARGRKVRRIRVAHYRCATIEARARVIFFKGICLSAYMLQLDLAERNVRSNKGVGARYESISGQAKSGESELVDLSRNHLRAVPRVFGCALAGLDLSHNPLDHEGGFWFQPISMYADLREIRLRDTGLTTLAGLSACRQLEHIDASFNAIATVSGLELMANLRSLRLADNRVRTIQAVRTLVFNTRLTLLDLASTPLSACQGYRMKVKNVLPTLEMLDDVAFPNPTSRSHIVGLYAARYTGSPARASAALEAQHVASQDDGAGTGTGTGTGTAARLASSATAAVSSSSSSSRTPRTPMHAASTLQNNGATKDGSSSSRSEGPYKGNTLRRHAVATGTPWTRVPTVAPHCSRRMSAPPTAAATATAPTPQTVRPPHVTTPRQSRTATAKTSAKTSAMALALQTPTSTGHLRVRTRLFQGPATAGYATDALEAGFGGTRLFQDSTSKARGVASREKGGLAASAATAAAAAAAADAARTIEQRACRMRNREGHERLGRSPRWMLLLMGMSDGSGTDRVVRPPTVRAPYSPSARSGKKTGEAALQQQQQQQQRTLASPQPVVVAAAVVVPCVSASTMTPDTCSYRQSSGRAVPSPDSVAWMDVPGSTDVNIFYAGELSKQTPPTPIHSERTPARVDRHAQAPDEILALKERGLELLGVLRSARGVGR